MVTHLQVGSYQQNPRYALQITVNPSVPNNIKAAKANLLWKQAMEDEILAFHRNQTRTLVPHTSAQNVFTCKWVCSFKLDVVGKINRHKACLVANGMRQLDGIDFQETFDFILKPATIHIILSIAIMNKWDLRQLDEFLKKKSSRGSHWGVHDRDKPHHLSSSKVDLLPQAIFESMLSSAPKLSYHFRFQRIGLRSIALHLHPRRH